MFLSEEKFMIAFDGGGSNCYGLTPTSQESEMPNQEIYAQDIIDNYRPPAP